MTFVEFSGEAEEFDREFAARARGNMGGSNVGGRQAIEGARNRSDITHSARGHRVSDF